MIANKWAHSRLTMVMRLAVHGRSFQYGGYHEFTKTHLRISMKVYHRNKNPARRAFRKERLPACQLKLKCQQVNYANIADNEAGSAVRSQDVPAIFLLIAQAEEQGIVRCRNRNAIGTVVRGVRKNARRPTELS